ncbi:manganese efflux pump [Puteibacter caeruleilacunae]|nr:manganese efflux pump [Puteibacter caeruleilacunae]
MDFLTLLLLAIGLSVDSFAVALGCSVAKKGICFSRSLTLAISLALFQGLMPVFGWLLGNSVKQYVEMFDHWIAFVLLAIIGAKMIIESKDENETCSCKLSWKEIFSMSLGTSIDALIVGFSFAFLYVQIWMSALIIGIVTLLFAIGGLYIGQKAGNVLGKKVEIFGGIVLILIGLKILLSHLFDHGWL